MIYAVFGKYSADDNITHAFLCDGDPLLVCF